MSTISSWLLPWVRTPSDDGTSPPHGETSERAVRCGYDTDTTAAIAGGLAGIDWGVGGIPPE